MRKLKNEELGRATPEELKNLTRTPLILVLDNVRSLNNIGSVFRTSDAFRVEAIYLCGITGTPPHREIQKTALGATETVPWKYFENTLLALNELQENQYQVYSIEQAEQSISLDEFHPVKEKKYAFVFGHEVFGVDEKVMEVANGCLEIPQFGSKHSLNIAVSAGIVVWDFFVKTKS